MKLLFAVRKSRETVDQLIGKINYVAYNETNIRFMVGIKESYFLSQNLIY